MNRYWVKIGVQALVIFGVGFGVMSVFRSGKRQVRRAVETTSDLTIPLPFLPFNLDGQRVGGIRKIVLHRSAPERVESVDVTVRVTDSVALTQFAGCSVTVDDPTRLNERSSFRCAGAEPGLEPFGSLRIQSRIGSGGWHEAAVLPLLLPAQLTRQIQGLEAQRHASDLERDRFRQLADSIRALAQQFTAATDAEARDGLKDRMEALEEEMADLREAQRAYEANLNMIEAARTMTSRALDLLRR